MIIYLFIDEIVSTTNYAFHREDAKTQECTWILKLPHFLIRLGAAEFRLIKIKRNENKSWWLCLIHTSTARFASDVGTEWSEFNKALQGK